MVTSGITSSERAERLSCDMDHLNTGAQDEFGNDISADIYLVRCARCKKRIGTYIVPGLKDTGVYLQKSIPSDYKYTISAMWVREPKTTIKLYCDRCFRKETKDD